MLKTQSAHHIWETTKGQLQLQVTRPNYDTWLKESTGLSCGDGKFVIGVPAAFAAEWLQLRLGSLIRKNLTDITGEPWELVFQVHQEPTPQLAWESSNATSTPPQPSNGERLTLAGNGSCPPPRLNPKYTFANFIVGSGNRLAHAAALSVAEKPGQGYNPLFIYGGSGLGKTHLLHAIGHGAVVAHWHVLYVSTEQFTNEFINAIRHGKTEEFRAKYRNVDMLLMDDIHFITGKEQTQESFFHTFNDLHNAGHQIVITSDRPPRSMSLLEDRLRSRFEWGLIADIQPPDMETRLAILRTKAEEQHTSVPEPALEFIARKVQRNIRELEGALNKIVALARLGRTSITLEIAAKALGDLIVEKGQRPSLPPASLIGIVAAYFGLEAKALIGPRRDKNLALARQVAMHLLRQESGHSLSQIGNLLGGRKHTTILHACKKIQEAIQTDDDLRRQVMEIRDRIYAATL